MKLTFGKRLIWFQNNIHGQSCNSFYRKRTMASDFQPGIAGSKTVVNKDSEEEKSVQVSKTRLLSFLQFVKFEKLSASEQLIHTKHLEALENGDDKYKDPLTGYNVFTRLAHLRRGACCGNACRHCPYGHQEVPEDNKKKIWNSAFYV